MRSLFGGAITGTIPTTLVDVSDLREVPDNQEVFVGSHHDFDISLIVELLEPVDKPNLMDALVFHVDESHRVSGTAEEDREQAVEVTQMRLNGHDVAERIDVVKTKENKVMVVVFSLFRLEEFQTEVFLTCSISPQLEKPSSGQIHAQKLIVRKLIESFKVEDPGLFNKSDK